MQLSIKLSFLQASWLTLGKSFRRIRVAITAPAGMTALPFGDTATSRDIKTIDCCSSTLPELRQSAGVLFAALVTFRALTSMAVPYGLDALTAAGFQTPSGSPLTLSVIWKGKPEAVRPLWYLNW
jgi:hypothetical protein